MKPKIRAWTDQEIQTIKDLSESNTAHEIAKIIERSLDKVRRKANELDIKIRYKIRADYSQKERKENFPVIKIGTKFGKLTVMSQGPYTKYHNKRWYCQCDCGNPNLKLIHQGSLRRGESTSCGCYAREITRKRTRKEPGHSSLYYIYNAYRAGSKRRNIPFALSFKDFKDLVSQNCFYCGKEPEFFNKYLKSNRQKKHSQGFNASEEGIDRATVYVNGIDRFINNIGYLKENCVPCCSFCNTMKMDRSEEDFLSHIYKIYEFQLNKNNKEVYVK